MKKIIVMVLLSSASLPLAAHAVVHPSCELNVESATYDRLNSDVKNELVKKGYDLVAKDASQLKSGELQFVMKNKVHNYRLDYINAGSTYYVKSTVEAKTRILILQKDKFRLHGGDADQKKDELDSVDASSYRMDFYNLDYAATAQDKIAATIGEDKWSFIELEAIESLGKCTKK